MVQIFIYIFNGSNNRIKLLANSKSYVNYEFDLSPNEKLLILSRSKINKNSSLSQRVNYIANTKNHRFKPFWNKNIASAELVFSPSSDAVLGFNPDLGYLLIPTEPVLDKVVEFGWLEHLKTYGFNKSGDKLIFSTSNSVEGITNFITIFSRGNVRTQYFFNNNRDFIELINFIPNQNKLAYLRNINLSEYIIQIFDYQRQEVQNLSLPGKSLEFLDVSANGRYLIVESYNSIPGQNYGPTLRGKIESFNNKFEAASILIIDMQNMNYLTIPFKGRKPTFAN